MNRLFGAKTNTPKPTLNSAISNVDQRIESIDVKLAKLNAELSTYQQRLSRMRDGPGKSAIKQKAIKILQQRKQYEAQKDQLQQQSWNMEQAGMMQDNLKNTMATVDAMKTTQKELKKQYGKVDIDKIERMQDEMQELMEVGNEIQESISRSYDVPEDVDEAELDAELEALGEEVDFGAEGIGEGEMPGFLAESAGPPQFIDEAPEMGKAKEAATTSSALKMPSIATNPILQGLAIIGDLYSDFTIRCDSRTFNFNRLVWHLHSWSFATEFNTRFRENVQWICQTNEPEVTDAMLEYFYTGSYRVPCAAKVKAAAFHAKRDRWS